MCACVTAYSVVSSPASALALRPDAAGTLQLVPTNNATIPLSLPGLPAAQYTMAAWAVSQG